MDSTIEDPHGEWLKGLVRQGALSPEDCARCLSEWDRLRARGEAVHPGQILIRERILDAANLARLLRREPEAAPDRPGFQNFEVEGVLGEGGMSIVYRAVDRKLRRPVALKVLRNQDRPGLRERFHREAKSLARLSHPNVVRIYEYGEDAGRWYLALELVDGGSFQEAIDEGRLDLVRRVETVATAARTVQYAHDRGILHRDLKPANLLMTREGTVKVSDFGLVSLAEPDLRLTSTTAILGTPLFMAPEQLRGSPSGTGPSIDVYALGVTLYCAIAGRPPFDADNREALFRKILSEPPEPPSRFAQGIPPAVERLALQALEKDPAARPASAGRLATDLGRALDGDPVTIRIRRQARRFPVRLAAAAVVVSLVVGAAVLLWRRRDPGPPLPPPGSALADRERTRPPWPEGWTRRETRGEVPRWRWAHGWEVSGSPIAFTGGLTSTGHDPRLWILELAGDPRGISRWLTFPMAPPSRDLPVLARAGDLGRWLYFGGKRDLSVPQTDLWSFDVSSGWRRERVDGVPTVQWDTQLAFYQESRKRLVLLRQRGEDQVHAAAIERTRDGWAWRELGRLDWPLVQIDPLAWDASSETAYCTSWTKVQGTHTAIDLLALDFSGPDLPAIERLRTEASLFPAHRATLVAHGGRIAVAIIRTQGGEVEVLAGPRDGSRVDLRLLPALPEPSLGSAHLWYDPMNDVLVLAGGEGAWDGPLLLWSCPIPGGD